MRRAALAGAVLLSAIACTTPGTPSGTSRATSGSTHGTSTGLSTSGVETPTSTAPSGGAATLAALVVDDRPTPDRPYVRDDWSHWDDTDGDGCDARQQSLIAHSLTAAQVDPFGCAVVTGDWRSIYDGVETSDPGDLDIDHVVPLENAHNAGGWRWTAERRREFANDQGNLIPVTASSNRSKGSRLPDEWRPPLESAWCPMAQAWVATKVRWELTVTSSERDALGQMLDSCAG